MEDAVRTQHAARKPITVSQGLEVGVRLRKLPQTSALLEGDVRYVQADSSQSKWGLPCPFDLVTIKSVWFLYATKSHISSGCIKCCSSAAALISLDFIFRSCNGTCFIFDRWKIESELCWQEEVCKQTFLLLGGQMLHWCRKIKGHGLPMGRFLQHWHELQLRWWLLSEWNSTWKMPRNWKYLR